MATENEKKTREGNVQLHTFESWGEKNVIGFETKGNMVVAVWCKLCAKHKAKLLANPTLRGKAKSDALKYTEKVTFVKKGNVERHLSGEAHKIAVQAEGLTCTTSESNTSTRGQVSIVSAMKDSSRKAYTKLFEAAYNLAEGMLPLNKFQVLVKCLRDNKVKLIQGRDDHRACEEFVSYIAGINLR